VDRRMKNDRQIFDNVDDLYRDGCKGKNEWFYLLASMSPIYRLVPALLHSISRPERLDNIAVDLPTGETVFRW
jgi:hypothetical protein